MTVITELDKLTHALMHKSQKLLEKPGLNSQAITTLLENIYQLAYDYTSLQTQLLSQPETLFARQCAYWHAATQLTLSYFMPGFTDKFNDKRFLAESWQNNVFFNALSQHYLLARQHTTALLQALEFTDLNEAKRLTFFAEQYLDALSPNNYLLSNPELLSETLQTGGLNLLKGLNQFLDDFDMQTMQLTISMSQHEAFKVGKQVAITPGEVIFQNDFMELIQYHPTTQHTLATPLLMIPPWINKYYILDLSAHNSMVRWLVDKGITVFMISWVNPDASFANKGFEDYLNEGPLAAIKVIKKQLNVRQVNTLGFCLGGTLLSCVLAYQHAQKKREIKSATFLASLIDFSEPGDLGIYIDEAQVKKLEEKMHAKGFLDGRLMASTFNSLRANDLIWSFFINNYLKGQKPAPFDILSWNADATNMPAAMHSQYLRWMYLQNDLIKPNKIVLNEVPLNIRAITTPSFFISTEKDHIAPWQTTYIGFQHFKGAKRFVLGGSGHIAGIINPPSDNKYHYYVNEAVNESAEVWRANAHKKAGSWWPAWFEWLAAHSGKKVSARPLTSLPYQSITAAPGRYVQQKNS